MPNENPLKMLLETDIAELVFNLYIQKIIKPTNTYNGVHNYILLRYSFDCNVVRQILKA